MASTCGGKLQASLRQATGKLQASYRQVVLCCWRVFRGRGLRKEFISTCREGSVPVGFGCERWGGWVGLLLELKGPSSHRYGIAVIITKTLDHIAGVVV